MEDYVAGESNQVLVSFLATQLSASGPIAYLVAFGVMALLHGVAGA
jgi:hypothetical protein